MPHMPAAILPATPAQGLRLVVSSVLVVALLTSLVPIVVFQRDAAAEEASGTVRLVLDGTRASYGTASTPCMHDGQTGAQLICAEPGKDDPLEGEYAKDYGSYLQVIGQDDSSTWADVRVFLIEALMYYTHPDSPGFEASLFPEQTWDGSAWNRESYIAVLHVGIASAYGGSPAAVLENAGDEFAAWAEAHVTGGISFEGSLEGGYTDDALWSRLLACEDGSIAGWSSAANPYADTADGFSVYAIDTGTAHQVCFGFDAFGWACVRLTSSLEGITQANRCYSLADAVFDVYADEECTQLVCQLVSDDDGSASSGELEPATYYLRQSTASEGYALDADVHELAVEACDLAELSLEARPCYAQAGVVACIENLETAASAPAAGATLQGALVTVSYYDDETTDGEPTRSWTLASDEGGRLALDASSLASGDALFTGTDGEAALAIGSYTVEMSAAPEGYIACEGTQTFRVQATCGQGDQLIAFESTVTLSAQVMRGEFSFSKVDEDGNALSGIPFLLSYSNGEGTTVEQHVVVTDEDGTFSSAGAAHSLNANANDAALLDGDATYDIDDSALDAQAGVWFSMDADGTCAAPDDALGALPYGSYTLEELDCASNHGRELACVSFAICENGASVELGAIENALCSLSTYARDGADGDKLLSPTSEAAVLDTVSYENLIVGESYTLTSELVLAGTGEALLDADGQPVATSTVIVPEDADESVDVTLSFDARGLEGEYIVVFETLSLDGGLVACHADIGDDDQTVRVLPSISTSACDAEDGDGYVTGLDATIVDTVSYEGLDVGSTYKLDALLKDATTGNVVRDANGNAISASKEVVCESEDGSFEMTLALDTSVVGGHDVVVFETLLAEDDTVLATHEDIEDEDQTVKTTGIDTVALDASDGDGFFEAQAASATVRDTVSYVNLEAGQAYTLTGTLVDRQSGEALVENGFAVTSSVTFQADGADGSIDVEFTFSPEQHDASQVVVFERLVYDGNEIACHEDLDDADQTLTALSAQESIVTVRIVSEADSADDEDAQGSDAVGTGEDDVALASSLLALTCAVGAGCAATAVGISRRRRRMRR